MGEILLSVIIPAYNTEEYISDCLNSFLPLNSDEIEVIVVDDGSTDRTPEIVQSYESKFKNFKFIKQVNQRQSIARNNGLHNAVGKYVYFCDSDDYVDPVLFEKFYKTAIENNLDIGIGGGRDLIQGKIIPGSKKDVFISKLGIVPGWKFYLEATKHNEFSILITQKIYKRDFILNNGFTFYPDILHEDEEIMAKFFSKATRSLYIRQIFYVRRHRQNSLTKNSIHKFFNHRSVPSFIKVIKSLIDFKVLHDLSDEQRLVINHGIVKSYLEILRRELYYKKEKIEQFKLSAEMKRDISNLIAAQKLCLKDRLNIARFKAKIFLTI